MTTDYIKEIKIDEQERLCIFPENERFLYIWRTATEVHWDDIHRFLYSPKPRDWSYYQWYLHIIAVAENECYTKLVLTATTIFTNMPGSLKEQILET